MPAIEEAYIRKFINGLPRHDRDLYSACGEKISAMLAAEPQLPKRLAILIRELESIGVIPKSEMQPLIGCLLAGISQGEIRFISMHSHALSRGLASLREKPQYACGAAIGTALQKISRICCFPFSYLSVLPDADSDFPLATHEHLWEENRLYLESASATKTSRLSTLAPGTFKIIESELPMLVDHAKLMSEIDAHSKSQSTLIDFSAPADFARKQIISYVVTGILFPDVTASLRELLEFGQREIFSARPAQRFLPHLALLHDRVAVE